jgi:hypothetical protein
VAQRAYKEPAASSVLETELAFFDSKRDEWLQDHRGEFALIKGEKLYGFYPSLLEGWRAGLTAIGYTDMLIKEVQEADAVHFLPTIW